MDQSRQELTERADDYARANGIAIEGEFGFGIHGIVFSTSRQSAIKVHERDVSYERERDVYLRLRKRGIVEVRGLRVPQLVNLDDERRIIEMTVVSRPFLLDFAGAYVDRPPNYPPEVMDEWRKEKEEQFGGDWAEVERVLWELEKMGIYLADVNPGNISLREEPSP